MTAPDGDIHVEIPASLLPAFQAWLTEQNLVLIRLDTPTIMPVEEWWKKKITKGEPRTTYGIRGTGVIPE